MTVVPVSGGMTERQLLLITDFRPDVIACTPSYALTLAQAFGKRGIGPGRDQPALRGRRRRAVDGVDAGRDRPRPRRAHLQHSTACRRSSARASPCECVEERNGSHVNEDHFLPEVVDPESGEQLPEGEVGVLVFTTLTKQALPLIRYWTGDLASLSSEPCSCGRTLVRMSAIRGRTDDMLIIRGVNVFPTQVEDVLGRVPELSPHYQLVVSRDGDDGRARGAHRGDRRLLPRRSGASCSRTRRSRRITRSHALRGRVSGLIKDTIGCSMKVTHRRARQRCRAPRAASSRACSTTGPGARAWPAR